MPQPLPLLLYSAFCWPVVKCEASKCCAAAIMQSVLGAHASELKACNVRMIEKPAHMRQGSAQPPRCAHLIPTILSSVQGRDIMCRTCWSTCQSRRMPWAGSKRAWQSAGTQPGQARHSGHRLQLLQCHATNWLSLGWLALHAAVHVTHTVACRCETSHRTELHAGASDLISPGAAATGPGVRMLPPFLARPRIGVRLLVQASNPRCLWTLIKCLAPHCDCDSLERKTCVCAWAQAELGSVVAAAAAELSGWDAGHRTRAALLLRAALVCAEEAAALHAHLLVPALCQASLLTCL